MMKKILYASTALIATAGVAAADISFSGYGRFGVGYKEDRGLAVGAEDTVIVSRFRLNIDGATETDSGVRFSARVRLQADEESSTGEANSAALNGARFTVQYEGLRVDVGNVAGSFDNLPGYYGFQPGLGNFAGQYAGSNYSFMGYDTGAPGFNGVFAHYAFGDIAVFGSYDSADVGAVSTDRWDIGASYSFGNITAALAYGETDGATTLDMTVLTLSGSWGDFSGTALIGDESVAEPLKSDTFYGFSVGYDLSGATTLVASYGDGSGDGDTQQFAIGAIYDLGGGASLRGGVGSSKVGGGASTTQADFGAVFNF